MCKMFEVVTGRKSKGSVDKLEGLTKAYTDMHEDIAIIRIPVELMEIDSRYQTDERTERDLKYLTNNWDERKLMPLLGVPHWEEGKVYIVDGYGRWIASQIVDKDKYRDLKVQLVLNAPTDDSERVTFEAELYAFQGVSVRKVTPIQKHGAMLLLHDPATETLEKMKRIYGFAYKASAGNRRSGILGSYTEALSLCAIDNGACAEYVYDIIRNSGFDRKHSGYVSYVTRSLRDMYKLYAQDRNETKKFLSNEFRKITPENLKANACSKYPILDFRTAVSLYVEDMIVNGLKLEQSRVIEGTKIVFIKKRTA